MDTATYNDLRTAFETEIEAICDERGSLTYIRRGDTSRQPKSMPVNIVMHHEALTLAGLRNQSLDDQKQRMRELARELVLKRIGPRTKPCFLKEEGPIEIWDENGPHLNIVWRSGCAQEFEEQTELRFILDAVEGDEYDKANQGKGATPWWR